MVTSFHRILHQGRRLWPLAQPRRQRLPHHATESMMKRLIATAALATLVATPALAQSYPGVPDEGFYLGTAIGQAKLKNDTLDWLDDLGASTDDKDTAFKLFAGYQFNPNFAVEASYVDFGDFTASGMLTDGFNIASGNVEGSIDGFGFALVGRLPIDAGFSVF